MLDEFDAKGIRVLAASADDRDTAQETVRKYKLKFPIGYGLDANAVAESLGAFYDEERAFLQVTEFIIQPDGSVGTALYSTGGMGRLSPKQCVGWIEYMKGNYPV